MYKLAKSISPTLFGANIEIIGEEYNLPTLSTIDKFGMFDIAYYLNDPNFEGPKDYNCAPHYDPGLISLSILATTSGLELQTADGTWIKGPIYQNNPALGVMWLGEAAVKASQKRGSLPLVAGLHKVSYANLEEKIPRLTMWYEICTKDQLMSNPDGLFLTADNKPAIKVKNIIGADIVVGNTNDTTKDILFKIEKDMGIPMSKSGIDIPFTSSKKIGNNWSITSTLEYIKRIFCYSQVPQVSLLSQVEQDYGVPSSKVLYE